MKSKLTNYNLEAWQVIHPANIRAIIKHVKDIHDLGTTGFHYQETMHFLAQLHENALVLSHALTRFEQDNSIEPGQAKENTVDKKLFSRYDLSPDSSSEEVKTFSSSPEITLESSPVFNSRFPHQYIPVKLTFELVADGQDSAIPTYRTYINNKRHAKTEDIEEVYKLYIDALAAARSLKPEVTAATEPTSAMSM